MEQEESAYITSLHLKGYKSIRDVSVTLNKGLNILIGANGSGKTNFLEFLDAAFELFYNPDLIADKVEYQINVTNRSILTKVEHISDSKIKGAAYKVEETFSLKNKNDTAIYFFNEDKKFIKSQKKYRESHYIPYHILFVKFDNPLDFVLKKKSI